MLVLSRKNLLACSQFPLITRAEYEEMRRDAYAPLEKHDLARVVAASDEPQPVQLDGVRVPGATAFYLDENDVEQVAALERSVAWLRGVLPDRQDINNATPLAMACAPERDELPPICDATAECTEYNFCPAARRVGFFVW